jgi:hypothetical protein
MQMFFLAVLCVSVVQLFFIRLLRHRDGPEGRGDPGFVDSADILDCFAEFMPARVLAMTHFD